MGGLRRTLLQAGMAVVLGPVGLRAQAPPTPEGPQAQAKADTWRFQAALYLYLPSVGGETAFPPDSSNGGRITLDVNDIVKELQSAFLGSFEVRKGAWGGYTDILYLDIGHSGTHTRGVTVGDRALPVGVSADTTYNLRGTLWTVAGSWRAMESPSGAMDLLFGTRMIDLSESVSWSLSGNIGSLPLADRAGNSSSGRTDWDAIAGIKGRVAFGQEKAWFLPYYADVGTGASRLTWQAMAGGGYTFGWGDLLVAWRYIGYDMPESAPIRSLNLNGPLVAATFRW